VTKPFPVVIFHNPDCGTSRNVLTAIEAAGYTPDVIDYQCEGWTKPQLLALFAAAGITPREALRETKSPAAELGLLEPGVAAERLLAEMVRHPILVNRPIVATPKGVALCRPSERVLGLLDLWPPVSFLKEDGTPMIPAGGQPS
jgi:arsenate reductase (glutaredoxin)